MHGGDRDGRSGPFGYSPEQRAAMLSIAADIESGNQESRRQFIAGRLPTPDRRLVDKVSAVMLATPPHVAANAIRGGLAFDACAAVALCRVPVLHLAATPPNNPPHLVSEWLTGVVHGWTVGAGHFNQLEVPDQVNAMIEAFLRHYFRGWHGAAPRMI